MYLALICTFTDTNIVGIFSTFKAAADAVLDPKAQVVMADPVIVGPLELDKAAPSKNGFTCWYRRDKYKGEWEQG